jgi:polyhydroxybutyrate depolymerase
MKYGLSLALAASLALLTACSAAAQPGGRLATRADATTEVKLQHDGRERRYLISDFSRGKPAPVVIVLHGGGGHPENAKNMSQMDAIARRENFIAVYPGGTGGTPGGRLLTWNAGHCCAYALENNVDDVGFIRTIIDDLVGSGRADPKRIFVTGMSNGAMMSHVLARALPDRIAAIAPIVGATFGDEPPASAPVAAIIFVGQDDDTVPAAGGPLGGATKRGGRSAEDHDVAPDIVQAEFWAKANGCAAPAEIRDGTGKAVEIRWEKCISGKPVHFHRVANNGHAWPGGRAGRAEADQPTQAVNASEMMWRFFKANPKS